jgi:phosphatidate cytidylyltransferase
MGKREAVAFGLMPVILLSIRFLPSWVYLAMVWLVTLGAAWELLRLLAARGHPSPLAPSLVLLGVGLPALWWLGVPWSGALLAAPIMIIPAIYLLGRYPVNGAAGGIPGAIFSITYLMVAGGAMGLLMTSFAPGLGWKIVFTHCLTVWGADSGAYYVGSRLGRHRMAPVVSPKKSWEGFAGGAATTVFGVWFCRTVFFPELSLPVAAALAALLIVVVPVGDLVESLFKRDAGVKDSSSVIPGHGGFFDRSDSLYFAAPFTLALLLASGLAR